MPETKRQTELDILRFLATLAVIMIHAGLKPQTGSASVQRIYYGIHAGLVWCVPVFFLISGRFFLDPARDISIQKILRRYLPHLIFPFLTWTAVFTVYYCLSGSYDHLSFFGILAEFIQGAYHLWFLYALAGLYLLTPILRKIAADETVLSYFLVLFFLVNITLEYLIYLPKVGGILENFVEQLGLQTITNYIGYYMLGFFLYHSRERIQGKSELAIYVLGIFMLFLTITAECLVSQELRESDFVKQYGKPNVIFYSAAFYLFFLKRVSRIPVSDKIRLLFAKLTEYGFGVYCIHAILNEFVPTPVFSSFPLLTSLLRVLCLYLLSLVATWLIRKIPYVGKKIT